MRFFAAALVFFGIAASHAQAPEVPHKMHFAGMTLTIRDDARKEIQADVNAFTRSAKYFNIKLERAKTYFPIIERIFAEERLPDDFKYLALQESALVADAVSPSNAVGFWQFKQETALEMGMRVDKEIDERMNIVSATRGAAKYLKKSNFYFNNWLYALQSYQMGAGGVQRLVGDEHNGAKHMTITSDTYWYVKKYLAHKVAYENALKGEPQLKIIEYQPTGTTSVKDISKSLAVEEAKLLEYNKWILKGTIPDDKKYAVLIPSGIVTEDFNKLYLASNSKSSSTSSERPDNSEAAEEKLFINDVPVIKAVAGETVTQLAKRAKVDLSDFIKFNDIEIDHRVKPGNLYFTNAKKSKAKESFHQFKQGDNLWAVSQAYGVQLKRLIKYNRLESEHISLPAGTQLWLSSRKPKNNHLINEHTEVVELSANETFEWFAGTITASVSPTLTLEKKNVKESASLNKKEDKILINSKSNTSSTLYHEVKDTDTLYSVARQYGVTIKELMDWNGKKELSVSVGEKLRVTPH